MNLGGTGGTREFDGPHYCIVLSTSTFHRATGMCLVLPTTSKEHPEYGALAVKLPPLEGLHKDGWALIHQARSIDFRERGATRKSGFRSNDPAHRAFIEDLIDRLFGITE